MALTVDGMLFSVNYLKKSNRILFTTELSTYLLVCLFGRYGPAPAAQER